METERGERERQALLGILTDLVAHRDKELGREEGWGQEEKPNGDRSPRGEAKRSWTDTARGEGRIRRPWVSCWEWEGRGTAASLGSETHSSCAPALLVVSFAFGDHSQGECANPVARAGVCRPLLQAFSVASGRRALAPLPSAGRVLWVHLPFLLEGWPLIDSKSKCPN